MTLITHISGVPVEKLLLPLAYGGGAMVVAARALTSGAPDRAQLGRLGVRPRSRARVR
jgi:hypothetical protein